MSKEKIVRILRKAAVPVAALLFSAGLPTLAFGEAGYITGDFHQHSTHSDGSVLEATTNSYNNAYGLDWWANSEHGGQNGSGATQEYRWQDIGGYDHLKSGSTVNTYKGLKNTWLETQDARGLYGNRTIIQGLEMNVPGHEHASTGIITNQYGASANAYSMAEFEYRFDKSDLDTSGGPGGIWTGKNTVNDKAKTLQAVAWLQANHATTSWFIPAHPERANAYLISDYRNFNNAGPTVAFGFESMPGHQKDPGRGGYGTSAGTGANQPLPSGQGGTFGGTGVYAAKVGGWWDALLSEGRNWNLFASSDYHADGADFRPGEYQKTYSYVADKSVVANSSSGAGAQAVVDSLRSGNSWVVEGDLIKSLEFKVGGAMMGMNNRGSTTNGTTAVYIKVYDPQESNPNNTYSTYTNPELDHIDLIAGHITGKINPFLADGTTPNPAYSTAVSDAAVIARIDATGGETDSNGLTSVAWTDLGAGWREMTLQVPVDGEMFFRLRGSNLGLGVANETDLAGNPLADSLLGSNTATKAFDDLWFYSNAVAVPEPGTLGLLGFGGLALMVRRRRTA